MQMRSVRHREPVLICPVFAPTARSAIVVSYEEMITDPRAALSPVAELCDLAVPPGPLPELGDDRGCAEPYRGYLETARAE